MISGDLPPLLVFGLCFLNLGCPDVETMYVYAHMTETLRRFSRHGERPTTTRRGSAVREGEECSRNVTSLKLKSASKSFYKLTEKSGVICSFLIACGAPI